MGLKFDVQEWSRSEIAKQVAPPARLSIGERIDKLEDSVGEFAKGAAILAVSIAAIATLGMAAWKVLGWIWS